MNPSNAIFLICEQSCQGSMTFFILEEHSMSYLTISITGITSGFLDAVEIAFAASKTR